MPLAKVTMQRQREIELRRTLREMRTAIDRYKDAVDQGTIPATSHPARQRRLSARSRDAGRRGRGRGEGTTESKLKFLRRVPSTR